MSVVAWFSAGAASAIAARITLAKYPDAIVARCVIDTEHPDNWRFADDVAQWLGRSIVELRSDRYTDPWDVWQKRRFLNGPHGALCTVELKKKVRQRFEDTFPEPPLQVFGYTVEEKRRADIFRENNPEVLVWFPLIEAGVSKTECFLAIEAAGLRLPDVYKPPFSLPHANCIPCVKGGAGYWNRIRVLRPDAFDRMVALEDEVGATVLNGTALRDLPRDAGRDEPLELPECGLFCGQNEGTLAAAIARVAS